MNQTVVRLFAALRGFVYASGFVFIWWLVVASVRPLDRRLGVAVPEWAWTPGLVLVILGGALAASCVASFALVGKGTPAPFDPPREFVAVGPYRYVRNPMYLGAVAVIIGAGLMIRSVSALAVSVIFMALAHVFVLTYEEPTLEGTFGASYRRYKSSVNRWVPSKPRTTLTGSRRGPQKAPLHIL